jgi:hypothetical protein
MLSHLPPNNSAFLNFASDIVGKDKDMDSDPMRAFAVWLN